MSTAHTPASPARGLRTQTRRGLVVKERALQGPLEAVQVASTTTERLVFLKSASDTAAKCGYRKPAKVLDAFTATDAIAAQYFNGRLPSGWKAAFREHGLVYADDVSQTARGKYPTDYQRTYQGRTVWLGPHIKLDRKHRIYFHIDDPTQKIVIGHVGCHLRGDRG